MGEIHLKTTVLEYVLKFLKFLVFGGPKEKDVLVLGPRSSEIIDTVDLIRVLKRKAGR